MYRETARRIWSYRAVGRKTRVPFHELDSNLRPSKVVLRGGEGFDRIIDGVDTFR